MTNSLLAHWQAEAELLSAVYHDWRLRTRIERGYRFDHIVPMSFGRNKV